MAINTTSKNQIFIPLEGAHREHNILRINHELKKLQGIQNHTIEQKTTKELL